MHVVLFCLPILSAYLSAHSVSVRTEVGWSVGPEEGIVMIYGRHTHTPEVVVGAWCITVIEADNAPTDSVLCPF